MRSDIRQNDIEQLFPLLLSCPEPEILFLAGLQLQVSFVAFTTVPIFVYSHYLEEEHINVPMSVHPCGQRHLCSAGS